MKILAIDGGGVRGVYAAHYLARLQEETGIVYSDYFDLVTGTSTGSIIAAAIASDYPLDSVVQLYINHADDIFTRKWFSWLGAFRTKFGSSSLESHLIEAFGQKTLSDVKTNLLIPATDVGNAGVHVFKSPYDSEFVRDKNVRIVDAVLASCSAPTYFKPRTVDKYLLADGGLWANNPSLVSLVEAKRRFKSDLSEVRLLSMGCGLGKRYYQRNSGNCLRRWGLLTGWGGSKLIDVILNMQSFSSANMVGLLLDESQYHRVDFVESGKLTLDDTSIVPNLVSRSDRDFTHDISDIKRFLGLNDAGCSEAMEAT